MAASTRRHGAWFGSQAIGGALALLLSTPVPGARADGDPPALYAVYPSDAEALPPTARLLDELARAEHVALRPVQTPTGDDAEQAGEPAQLAVLHEVERALLEARELNAELREAAALRVLAGAEKALLEVLDLPGVHTFLAEVHLQLALCAAQLDENGLFESALARALSLDPSRRIEAAEAPPPIVKRAEELAQRRELAPLSEGRLAVEPPDASAWLDGARISAADLSFRARAGLHLLVVRAPGHAPYAALLQLEQGRRPLLSIALSPRPAELARRALLAARARPAREQHARALAAAAGQAVYLLELASGNLARALVQRCSPAGCGAPEGLPAAGGRRVTFAEAGTAHAWLNATIPTQHASAIRQDSPVWKRWPLWTGAAALVVAGVVTAVLVTRAPEPRQELTLEIDASALPH